MSVRHVALAAIATAVLGMIVYLFVEVRSGAASPPPVAASGPQASGLRPPAEEVKAPATEVAKAPVAPVKKVDAPAPTAAGAAPSLAPGEEAHDDISDGKPNPKLDAVMDQANKAYDRQDFDEAKAIAGKVLAKMPNNVRMLRIMVSSSCIDGDFAVAQKYFPMLPKFDRDQMKVRCDRYGVTLTDPPQQ